MYTVHIREKPARPFVAVAICALLLGSLSYGAWRFSRIRSDATLGHEIAPAGWPLVFRLADSWRRVNEDAADADWQLIFWRDEEGGVPSKLIIRRTPSSKQSAARQCEQSLREYFGVFAASRGRYEEPMEVSPGQLQGSFLLAPERGYAVFVGNWRTPSADNERWIIELITPPPLWLPDVHFFRRFTESFRPL